MNVKKTNNSIKDIEKLINLMLKTKTEYVKVGTTEIRLSQLALIEQSSNGLDMFSNKQSNSDIGGNSVANTGSGIVFDPSTTITPDDDLLFHSVK
jgi:hypothetical protein